MFEKVCDMLSEFTEFPRSEMKPDSLLIADLGMNSLNMMEAVVTLEKGFDVEVSDKKLFELRTIDDVCRTIEELRAGK